MIQITVYTRKDKNNQINSFLAERVLLHLILERNKCVKVNCNLFLN